MRRAAAPEPFSTLPYHGLVSEFTKRFQDVLTDSEVVVLVVVDELLPELSLDVPHDGILIEIALVHLAGHPLGHVLWCCHLLSAPNRVVVAALVGTGLVPLVRAKAPRMVNGLLG